MSRKNNNNTVSNAPYFMAYKQDGSFRTAGQTHVNLGHRITTPTSPIADGIHARWCWDGNKLTVTNDRYGIYPLFWCELPEGGIAISSSLIKLIEIGAPVELDMAALAVFFRLGTFVGNDTAFAAINVVPPSALFEWQDGQLQCRGRYPDVPQPAQISRDKAIDQYIALFAQAIARRPPPANGFAVPVSGGRDSRHILLELHRMKIQPAANISVWDNPPDPNEDPKIGKLLCDALDFQHTNIHQQLSIIRAEFRKNEETHLSALTHGWYLALADYVTPRFDCIYDGLGGDVLSQSSNLRRKRAEAFQSRDIDRIANRLLFGGNVQTDPLNRLINPKLQKALSADIARERIGKEIEKHLDMPNPTSSFFFWNRTRRMTAQAPYGLLSKVPTVYAPFLDHDLFDFLTSLPTAMVMDHKFHDDAIARAYPSFAHIPYADHKAAQKSDARRTRRKFLAEATRYFLLRPTSELINNTSVRSKLLAGLLSCGHIRPWIPMSIIYLRQLETITDNNRNR